MSSRSIWEVLGIEATEDLAQVRKGYARRLKLVHPEDDPEGFQELREAYELAQRHIYFQLYEAARAAEEAAAEVDVGTETPVVEPVRASQTDAVMSGVATESPITEPSTEEERLNALFQADVDRMNADLAEMQAMLVETPPPTIRLKARFEAILASPALDNFAIAADFEPWIEQVLIAHLPASDLLIPMAIEHFRWASLEDAPYRRIGDLALARDQDLRVLAQMRRRRHTQHAAFKALTISPNRWRTFRWQATPGLEEEVLGLLSGIRAERPGLLHNLDAKAVAWWESVARRPRIGLAAFLSLAGLPIAMLSAVAPERAEVWWPAALASSGALLAAYFYGVVRPRFAWRAGGSESAPAWVKYGWAGAGLLLPALGAAALQSGIDLTIGAIGLTAVGLATAGWARVTGEPAFPEPKYRRSGRFAIYRTGRGLLRFACILYYWVAMALLLEDQRWVLMVTAGLLSVLVFLTGGGSLQGLAAALPVKVYKAAFLPLAVILTVLTGLVAILAQHSLLAPWVAAVVGALALADIVTDSWLSELQRTQRAWWSAPAMFPAALIMMLVSGERAGAVELFAAWMLLLLALSLFLVHRQQTASVERARI